jgi:signal peptidase II
MQTKKSLKNLSWIFITIFVIAFDRYTKYLIAKYFVLNEAVPIFPSLNLFYTLNKGAAFSFLNQASGWQIWFFAVIAVVVSVFIVIWLLRLRVSQPCLKIALALILGGTLGNLYDRIFYGYVTDFIDVYYKTWHWPSFNVADSAICVGAFILVIDILFKKDIMYKV